MKVKYPLLIIYVIAFSMGIFFMILNLMPYDEQSDYDAQARNLLQGRGISSSRQAPYFPDVYRTPGMGMFLYLIYSIFGINYIIVRVIQVALNAIVPIFIFYLSKRIFNERFAYIAAFAVAIYPFTTLYALTTGSETLSVFLFCLGLLLFEKGRAANNKVFFFLSGITYGFCLLVRPGVALMPLFLTIAYLLAFNFKRIWKYLIIFNFSVLLIWSPWIVRNYLVSGRFIPLTAEGHEMIYWATGSSGRYFDNRINNPKFIGQLTEITRELEAGKFKDMERLIKKQELYQEYSFKNIKDEPFQYLFSNIFRIPRMWISYVNTDPSRSYQFIGSTYLYIFITLFMAASFFIAMYGMWLLRRKWRQMIFLAMPIFYFSLTHMFILAEARYTLPARPFLLIFAIFGLLNILRRISPGLDRGLEDYCHYEY